MIKMMKNSGNSAVKESDSSVPAELVQEWTLLYAKEHPVPAILQKTVDAIITTYEEQEKQDQKQPRNAPDSDGFITVTHSSSSNGKKRPFFLSKSDPSTSTYADKRSKRRNKEPQINFYHTNIQAERISRKYSISTDVAIIIIVVV